MDKKYDYHPPYEEKNTEIEYRKCKKCNKFKKIGDLENKTTCKLCYVQVWGKKRCSKCLIRKNVDMFKKSSIYKDGLYSKCLDCMPKSTKEQVQGYNKKHYLIKVGKLEKKECCKKRQRYYKNRKKKLNKDNL